ncbi:hypothetical protein ASPTUDRAFT_186596 [Aspergillus tubingensis CBS 134.48]|uniref:Uncharacterized protein n=1 Tax=Aspergillus tubingensis (strain CBS 134.48) TaxID=767770 RepID=A0A1L9NNE5_ASPTC|nr:hypothetical protein ASPTUDRAFT_186596 [Aspergillus tubingensis CBS 134.48]
MFAPMRYGKTQEPLYLETQPSRQGRVFEIQDRLKRRGSRRPSSISSTLSSAADPRQRAAAGRAKRIVTDTTIVPLATDDSSPETLPQIDCLRLDDTQNNVLAHLKGWPQDPQEDQLTILEPNSQLFFGSKNGSFMLSDSSLTGQSEIQSMAVPSFEGNLVSSDNSQNLREELSKSSLSQPREISKNVPRDVLSNAPTPSRQAWNTLLPVTRYSDPTCACIQKVLELHEEVEEVGSTSRAMSMGESLALQIAVLRKCLNIVDCEVCTHSSAISMLLVTICSHLLHISQAMSSQLWKWFMRGSRLHPQLATDLQDAEVHDGSGDPRGKLSMDQLVSIGA